MNKAYNPAGYGIVDTRQQFGLLAKTLGILLRSRYIQIQAVDHPVSVRVLCLFSTVNNPLQTSVLTPDPVFCGILQPAVFEGFRAVGQRLFQVRRVYCPHRSAACGLHKLLHRIAKQAGRLPAHKCKRIGIIVIADFKSARN